MEPGLVGMTGAAVQSNHAFHKNVKFAIVKIAI